MIVQWAGTRRTGLASNVVTWGLGVLTVPVPVSLAGVLSFAGNLDFLLFQQVALAGAASFDGGVSMMESVPLAGSVSFSGEAVGALKVAVDGAVEFGGAVALKALIAVEGVLTTAGEVAWTVKHGLSGAVSFTGDAAVKVFRSLTGVVSFAGALSLIPFTLTILANAIQARYKPRALFTLTIGAVTKRYSTKDVEVPDGGQFGDMNWGDDWGGT